MLHHDHWLGEFATCPAEEESSDSLPPVKFLKSEPVQHKKAWAAQNEWVHDELNFVEFVDWMHTLYDNVYKLHNFDARWQTRNMKLCLQNMLPSWVVLQWDFGNAKSDDAE